MMGLGVASEDEVVLAFLRAEIDSPKRRVDYLPRLQALRLNRTSLIDLADLSDASANHARRLILGAARGYGRGEWLFKGFPADTKWERVLIEPADFGRLKYISRDADWLSLSGRTRLVQDGARNLDANRRIAASVREAQQIIEQGRAMVELILVEAGDGALVVVEGHTRATAFAVLADRPFRSFVGRSPSMSQWSFI